MRRSKAEQDPLGRCYTRPREARLMASILERHLRFSAPTILDPAVGGGSLLLAAREAVPVSILVGIDLDPDATADGADVVHRATSYLDTSFPPGHEPHGIIANPPFSLAKEFVQKSLMDLRIGGVAVYLLPVAFSCSTGRKDLWNRYPATEVHFLMDRPKFDNAGTTKWKGSGGDSKDYAVYVWRSEHVGESRCLWRGLDPTKQFWV